MDRLPADRLPPEIARRLRWPLRLTWAGMFGEVVVRRFWPLWTVCALALGLAMFGLAGWPGARWLLGGLGMAAVLALGWGLWGLRVPRWNAALARLDSRLPGRPLAALADTQAVGVGDSAAEAVWRLHQRRAATASRQARADAPDLRVSASDVYGLRYMALLLLAMAGLFGSAQGVGSVAEIARAPGAGGGPAWDVWAEPPRYTGRPSLYLNDIEGEVELPEGSRVTVRLYGEQGALALRQDISGAEVSDASLGPLRFDVSQSGTLAIDGAGGRVWSVVMLPDFAPEIAPDGPAKRERGGAFTLPFHASDDHRVVTGRVEITLDVAAVDRRFGLRPDPKERPALVLDLPVPYSGARDEIEEVLADDVSLHPFANLPVQVRLFASDDLGQEGMSDPMAMVLPGKRFFQPVARALAEQRRDMLWSPEGWPRVAQVLRAVAWQGADQFPDVAQLTQLASIIEQVEALSQEDAAAVDEVAQAMWQLALDLEEASLESARERLRRAQERLEEAMRNGASPEEIAELMDELRAAKDDYMRMLAEQAEPEPGADEPGQQGEAGQTITQDQIDQMMDEIQSLMEQGRMAEAQLLMEQLSAMLENLQMREAQGQQGGAGSGAMQGLGETLRDQQELSDQAFEQLQQQFGEGRDGTQGNAETLSPEALAEQQRALRERLDQQRGQVPGLPGAEGVDPALDDAGRAMDRSEEALRRGDMAGALEEQADALRALREGMRELQQAMTGQRSDTEGEAGGRSAGEADGDAQGQQTDPLGRADAGNGSRSTGGPLAELSPQDRARGLENELSRRQSDTTRPEDERDYFGRLLDRF